MTTPFTTHWLNQATDRLMKQFITIICLMLALSVSAQNQPNTQRQNNGQPQRQAWGQFPNRNRQPNQQAPNQSGQFSAAEYARQQREFFTKNAELTQAEADEFFPVYNELQQKKRELNRDIRRIMRVEPGSQVTEEQSIKAIDAKADVNIKIAELEKEYLQKFKKILPASKILKIQNAEEQFNSQILKDIQQSRGHQFQQNQGRPGQPQFNPQTPDRQVQQRQNRNQ